MRTKTRDRLVFVLVLAGVLYAVAAWRGTGPPTTEEVIRANEGE